MMAGEELPLMAIRGQIASAIDIMVHLGRMRDGSRKVLNISQVEGIEDGSIKLGSLFEYKYKNDRGSQGELIRTNTALRIKKGMITENYEQIS